MARRTKQEMEQMRLDVRYYLYQTNNNPHAAFDLMIKEHLHSGQSMPFYIKSIKDFIKVSQELALELGRKEQMAKRDKELAMAKESVISYIMNLSKEDIKSIYRNHKDSVTHSQKLVLHDVYMMIHSDDMQEKYINQSTINVFSKIMVKENEANEEVAVSNEDTEEEEESNMTNQLNQTVSNLINSYPNYNQSDIQTLDNLAQYADIDTLSLIGKFLHTVHYLNGKDSLTFLHAIYSQLDTEEAATHEDEYNATQSYSYTVTDGYLPEPLSGTIEADTPIHADQLIRDIYASELDTTESELTIEIYQ